MADASYVELPRRPPRRSAVWSGVFVLLLIDGTITSAFLVSYYYLRLGTPLWPPADVELPSLVVPTIATFAFVASGAVAWVVDRALREDRPGRIRRAFPLGLILVTAYLALSIVALRASNFSYRDHAYGSIFFTIAAVTLAHAIVVLLMGGSVWGLSLLRPIDARLHAAIEGTALFWVFVAILSIPAYLVLYVSPYLI